MRAFWKVNAAARPAPDKEAEQLKIDVRQAMFDKAQIDDFSVGGTPLYGYYPEDAWKRLIAVMHGEGQIARADLDLSKLYTNAFVEEINKFDREAVAKAAKAAK